MNTLATVIKRTRIESGLSQKEFGERLTVGQPYISRIEQGKEYPTAMFIKLFCLMFKVDENLILRQNERM